MNDLISIILKVGSMKLSVNHWDGGLLGNVSFMKNSAMFGLMKMQTHVINPVSIDMPLLSLDLVVAMGNVTMIAELYDTTLTSFDQKGFESV